LAIGLSTGSVTPSRQPSRNQGAVVSVYRPPSECTDSTPGRPTPVEPLCTTFPVDLGPFSMFTRGLGSGRSEFGTRVAGASGQMTDISDSDFANPDVLPGSPSNPPATVSAWPFARGSIPIAESVRTRLPQPTFPEEALLGSKRFATEDRPTDLVRAAAIMAMEPFPTSLASRSEVNAPKRVAIVVPARNEAETLSGVLRAIPDLAPECLSHVFVVDDGSSDDTANLARACGATVVRHGRNLGIGASLTTGFLAAQSWKPDVYVQLDADGQHDPALLPSLLGPVLRGEADLVIGSRFRGSNPKLSGVRRVGVHFYTRLVRLLTGYNLTDVTSGYRVFRRDAYDRLAFRAEKNWAIETTLRAGLNGVRMVEVPTPFLERKGGQSQFSRRRLFFLYNLRAPLQVFRAFSTRVRTRSAHALEAGVARPVPIQKGS